MMVTGMLARTGFHALDHATQTIAGQRIPHTWVIAADSEQAHIYRKTAEGLERIAHASALGKQIESVDDHIFSPQSLQPLRDAPSRKDRHRDMLFIRRLVEWLDVAGKEKAFDQLIIVAAPYTLGNIRSVVGKNLQARICGTLNKDLTRLSAAEVQEHLDKVRHLWLSMEGLSLTPRHEKDHAHEKASS